MLDVAAESARKLFHEIWDVDREQEQPDVAKRLGRFADRLSNIGAVLIYTILVAWGVSVLYHAVPTEFRQAWGLVGDKWWFWAGLVLIVATALRFGLVITKTLKRWNVASLVGSVLLIDFLLKQGPPLFGMQGVSVVDAALSGGSHHVVSGVLQKALGF